MALADENVAVTAAFVGMTPLNVDLSITKGRLIMPDVAYHILSGKEHLSYPAKNIRDEALP